MSSCLYYIASRRRVVVTMKKKMPSLRQIAYLLRRDLDEAAMRDFNINSYVVIYVGKERKRPNSFFRAPADIKDPGLQYALIK